MFNKNILFEDFINLTKRIREMEMASVSLLQTLNNIFIFLFLLF